MKVTVSSVSNFWCAVSCFLGILLTRSLGADNFALLSGALRTFQAHACDGEELRLNCTPDTVISIQLVQYGSFGATPRPCQVGHEPPENSREAPEECISSNAVKVIEEKCRGQRMCRQLTSPLTFQDDLCPDQRKYAEVAYKCRPVRFVNKIACEGKRMRLSCPPSSRILVYSAYYGSTSLGVLECPQVDRTSTEECQSSYATEAVIGLCSGQRKCSMSADNHTFGSLSCSENTANHLKVTFACVSEDVLKWIPPPEGNDGSTQIYSTSYPGWARGLHHSSMSNHRPHSTTPSHTFKLEMQSDEVPADTAEKSSVNQTFVGFMKEWISAHKYVAGNKDKLILYVAVSTGIGFLVFVSVVAIRLILVRSSSRRSSKQELSPPSDDQFISESDIEQFEPQISASVEPAITNYTSTLRRHDSDALPKAPVTTGAELDHYFS